jgi:menaquinone-dependent protoporphyrinogen oxidase
MHAGAGSVQTTDRFAGDGRMLSGPCGPSLRWVNGPDRVLVAYGTKHGATAEIAQVIADTLRAAGLQVDVQRARRVRFRSLEPYRAVVLGSAVYSGRWRPDAVRLLRRPQLKAPGVWLFSSGPVGRHGDPEQLEKWTKPPRVTEIAESIGVREHVVFGGMVAMDAGFIRKKMARNIPPELRDRRDWHQIEAWAESIATALTGQPTP